MVNLRIHRMSRRIHVETATTKLYRCDNIIRYSEARTSTRVHTPTKAAPQKGVRFTEGLSDLMYGLSRLIVRNGADGKMRYGRIAGFEDLGLWLAYCAGFRECSLQEIRLKC